MRSRTMRPLASTAWRRRRGRFRLMTGRNRGAHFELEHLRRQLQPIHSRRKPCGRQMEVDLVARPMETLAELPPSVVGQQAHLDLLGTGAGREWDPQDDLWA